MSDYYNIVINGTDYSKSLASFIKKEESITFVSGEYLYVGFYKPFNNAYIYMTTANSIETEMNVEYYNGNNWLSVHDLDDRTYGLSESGLVSWRQYDDNLTFKETEVNGDKRFWHRFSFNADITATFKAIGVIFSDDNDIRLEAPILDSDRVRRSVVGSDVDFMKIHVQARDYIVQEIRNNGIKKYNDEPNTVKFFRQITEFDLFDLSEIKLAARMLAISNIYYKMSDETDDKWQYEGERYRKEYQRALDIAYVSLDRDDDGELDTTENLQPIKPLVMSR